jgi:hypothetical protein
MNKHDDQLTKSTVNLIASVGSHVHLLFDRGIVEQDKVRLTIQARKDKAKELVNAGVSQRKAAKALQISATVTS